MARFMGGFFAAVLLLVGCGEAPDSNQALQIEDPQGLFAALEDRLIAAGDVEIDYDVTAEGAVEVDLRGNLRILDGKVTEVAARGRFAGKEVDLLLRSDGGHYEFGNGPDRTSSPTPAYLNEALLIGLTRMGILHNLAMLVGNAPPDGADGGVRDWAVVESFSFEDAEGAREGSRVVSFSMVVAGTPAGSVALEINADGNPVLRRQTVHFPGGHMQVVERYTSVHVSR